MVAFVELARDVDVIGGMLQQWIDGGVTRCVRAVGVDEEWDAVRLKKMAEEKGRKLEGISDGKNAGGVSLTKTYPYFPPLIDALAGSHRGLPFLQDRRRGPVQSLSCTRSGVGALQRPFRRRPLRHSHGRAFRPLST